MSNDRAKERAECQMIVLDWLDGATPIGERGKQVLLDCLRFQTGENNCLIVDFDSDALEQALVFLVEEARKH